VTVPEVLPPRRLAAGEQVHWDDSADTVVVGFGGAGACAAIEAAERGADVLALDRLVGGGDTSFSGGAIYAGGGTEAQLAAGFTDSAENMYAYLRLEVDGAVDHNTLRRFCAGSLDDVRWLNGHGVRFGTEFFPHKTPFPPNGYYLFYSGSEQTAPFDKEADPVPRAHKTDATGMGAGSVFYAALAAAAERAGVRVRRQTSVRRLVLDAGGRVVGVECSTFPAGRAGRSGPAGRSGRAARLHAALAKTAIATPATVSVGPLMPTIFAALRAVERRAMRETVLIEARRGVVLCTGGYSWNPQLIAEHAPYAKPLMPIGFDTNGSGLLLGQTIGADTGYLDNVGVFKMFVPPLAFGRGMLVDSGGRRFTNEFYYSGRVGRAMRELPGGKVHLILDSEVAAAARAELPKLPLFSSAPARMSLARAVKAGTLDELARKLGMPVDALRASADSVAATAAGAPDGFGKSAASSAPLRTAPFLALDMSLDTKPIPATTFSIGGLRVDGVTGAVLRPGGTAIPGLYAAGRAAVGLCSNSYVSGLSLADCVFSGRRAGAATAGASSSAPSPTETAAPSSPEE
jgi:3-oxo-5alpha-steroid 4-dehydrogenase